jgi:energy-coupling factor transport system ATP-binding protein
MINIENITVRYSGQDSTAPALNRLSLLFTKGEYAAITGPNGSGKSTLIKAVCGLVELESGSVSIDGTVVRSNRFGEDLFGIAAVVFQEPGGQFLMPDVESEIMAVLQNMGLSLDKQKEKAREIVEQFSLEGVIKEKPENLSGGQTQLVNLACAVAMSPSVLLLDEPTTFLDLNYRQIILEALDDLAAGGLTIIHVTQYPDETLRAKRLVILNGGELAAYGDPESILTDEKTVRSHRLAVPRNLAFVERFGFDVVDDEAVGSFVSGFDNRIKGATPVYGKDIVEPSPALEAENIRFGYRGSLFCLKLNHLMLLEGQITGLVGPAGSGKSTLAFLLAGLLEPDDGDIFFRGKILREYGAKALRCRIGMSWQMPERTFVGPTVADDLCSIIDNLDLQETEIGKILVDVGLEGFDDRIVDSLSGGEKRKLSLAGAMLADPDYLILDEPAAFLDPATQKEIGEIVKGLAESGRGVLVVSHDLPFLAEIADRVVGLNDGCVAFDISALEFFSDPLYQELLNFPPEPIVAFRHRLVKSGVELATASMDPAVLFSGILRERSDK